MNKNIVAEEYNEEGELAPAPPTEKSKYAIVINADGYKVNSVRTEFTGYDENARPIYVPCTHKFKDDEALVFDDVSTAIKMHAPRWVDGEWVETGEPDTTEEEMEQLRQSKLIDAAIAMSATVFAGLEINTSKGKCHFSLSDYDQANLIGLKDTVKSLIEKGKGDAECIPYHSDGDLCDVWTPNDMDLVIKTAMDYITYHQTRLNHINSWIRRLLTVDDRDELMGISYASALPEDLEKNMGRVLSTAASINE